MWARLPHVEEIGQRLRRIQRDHEMVTATPVLLEAGFSARSPVEWDATMAAMSPFRVLHPTDGTHTIALGLQRARWRGGRVRAAGAFDTVIAALALEHDAVVLHHDRDFAHLAAVEPALRHEWVVPAGSL